jgi:hypothetical protein
MSKGNKGNLPERKLEAEAKRALRTSVYIQRTLKQHLQKDSYITALSLCLEKRSAIYYVRRTPHCTCLELKDIAPKLWGKAPLFDLAENWHGDRS